MLRENFKYNGHWLSDFSMKMYDPDNAPQWVARTVDKSTPNPAREIPYHFTTHYDDVLRLDFLIIRDPGLYGSPYDLRLTDRDIHKLRSWLEYPKQPMELVTTEDEEQMDVCYFGLFTSIQPFVVATQCYGLQLTFTCNAPYGFSPLTAKRYELPAASGANASTLVGDFLNSAISGADMLPATIVIYPADKTADLQSGTCSIYNKATDKTMVITVPDGNRRLTIDCGKRNVIAERVINGVKSTVALPLTALHLTSSGSFFGDETEVFSVEFLKLLPGSNLMTFTSSIEQDIVIEIQTRYILKAGGF